MFKNATVTETVTGTSEITLLSSVALALVLLE